MYAIINDRGNQVKVAEGEIVNVDKMKVAAGESVVFDKVLLVENDGDAKIGAPTVEGAQVEAEVLGETLGKKVVSFKFKRRKGFKKTIGHRAQYTQLKIKAIKG